MTNTQQLEALRRQDQFGRSIAARLTAGSTGLPNDISERLRVARQQAVALRKKSAIRTAPAIIGGQGASATLGFGDGGVSWWNRIASALPLVVLAAGLVTIHVVQNDRRASEVAEVDAALLTDTLPPAAYADPGFAQFLRSGEE